MSQGVFTLFAIVFFLLGLALFGIGLIGEYVGRTYEQVRGRPRYLIAAVLAPDTGTGSRAPAGARDHPCLAPSSSPTAKSDSAACRCCWITACSVPLVVHARGLRPASSAGSAASLTLPRARRARRDACRSQCRQRLHCSSESAELAPDYILSFYYRSMLPTALLAWRAGAR